METSGSLPHTQNKIRPMGLIGSQKNPVHSSNITALKSILILSLPPYLRVQMTTYLQGF
jgi:hypothetical protein